MFFYKWEENDTKSEGLLVSDERDMIRMCLIKQQISNITHHEEAKHV